MKTLFAMILVLVSAAAQANELSCELMTFELSSADEFTRSERGPSDKVLNIGTVEGFDIQASSILGQVLIKATKGNVMISSVAVSGKANLRFQDDKKIVEAFCQLK